MFFDQVKRFNLGCFRSTYTGKSVDFLEEVPNSELVRSFVCGVTRVPYFSFGLLLNRGKNKASKGAYQLERADTEQHTTDESSYGRVPVLWSIYQDLKVGFDLGRVYALFRKHNREFIDFFPYADCRSSSERDRQIFESAAGNGLSPVHRRLGAFSFYIRGLNSKLRKSPYEMLVNPKLFVKNPLAHLSPSIFLNREYDVEMKETFFQ